MNSLATRISINSSTVYRILGFSEENNAILDLSTTDLQFQTSYYRAPAGTNMFIGNVSHFPPSLYSVLVSLPVQWYELNRKTVEQCYACTVYHWLQNIYYRSLTVVQDMLCYRITVAAYNCLVSFCRITPGSL